MRDRMTFITVLFLVAVTVFTVAQTGLRTRRLHALSDRPKPDPIACVGEPIQVEENYGGGPLNPWSCKVQCEDNVWRYLVYRNGYATQCAPPPDCTDNGEDDGITCIPPEERQTSSGE